MKPNPFKPYFLPVLFFTLITIIAVGCKKDKITVDQEKSFLQVDPPRTVNNSLEGGSMHVTLKPGGVADINPGGDILYRGTYKIKGDQLKIKVSDFKDDFEFKILSETDIKEKNSGVVLRWEK